MSPGLVLHFLAVEASAQPLRLYLLCFFFLFRRSDQCWLSSGSWPFWLATPCTCFTRSVLSSCTTGRQNSPCARWKQVITAREEKREALFFPCFGRNSPHLQYLLSVVHLRNTFLQREGLCALLPAVDCAPVTGREWRRRNRYGRKVRKH